MVEFNIIKDGKVMGVDVYVLSYTTEKIPLYAYYNDGYYPLEKIFFMYVPDQFRLVTDEFIPHLSNSSEQLIINNNPNLRLIEDLVSIAEGKGYLEYIDDQTVGLYIYDKLLYMQNIFYDPEIRNEWLVIDKDEIERELDEVKMLQYAYEFRNGG